MFDWTLFLYVILADLAVEVPIIIVLVLFVNPKATSRRIPGVVKDEILSDDDFIRDVTVKVIDEAMIENNMPKFEPLLQKIQNRISGISNLELANDSRIEKAVTKAFVEDLRENKPEYGLLIDAIRSYSPKTARMLEQHPEMIGKTVSRLRAMGIPLPDISGESEDSDGVEYTN